MKPITYVLVAALLTCGAGAAEAQTCTIARPADQPSTNACCWAYFHPGTIVAFGDLKIRANSIAPLGVEGGSYVEAWINVDLKAPGFELRNVTLQHNVPRTMTICGQEVTVSFISNGLGVITVGVF